MPKYDYSEKGYDEFEEEQLLEYKKSFLKKLEDIGKHGLTVDENKKFKEFMENFVIDRDITSRDDYNSKLHELKQLLPIQEHETSFSKKLERLEREKLPEYELTVNNKEQARGKYLTERGSIYGEELPRHASANYDYPKNAKKVRISKLPRGGKRKLTKKRRPTKKRKSKKSIKRRRPTKKRRAGKSSRTR